VNQKYYGPSPLLGLLPIYLLYRLIWKSQQDVMARGMARTQRKALEMIKAAEEAT